MSEKDFLKEKELLLDSIENNTSEHWKNYYKDVPIECIYDDLVIDINEIKRLQQENQQLKDKIDKAIEYIKELDDETDDTIYDISRDIKMALVNLLKGDKE